METLWREIYDKIAIKIINGTLKYGEQLPSIRNASVENEVSEIVIKKVYDELKKSELIYTVHGKGVFVNYYNKRADYEKALTAHTISNVKKDTISGIVYTLNNLYCEMLCAIDSPPYYDLLRLGVVKMSAEMFEWFLANIPEDMKLDKYLELLKSNLKEKQND